MQRWAIRIAAAVLAATVFLAFFGGSTPLPEDKLPAVTQAAAEHYAVSFVRCEMPQLAIHDSLEDTYRSALAIPDPALVATAEPAGLAAQGEPNQDEALEGLQELERQASGQTATTLSEQDQLAAAEALSAEARGDDTPTTAAAQAQEEPVEQDIEAQGDFGTAGPIDGPDAAPPTTTPPTAAPTTSPSTGDTTPEAAPADSADTPAATASSESDCKRQSVHGTTHEKWELLSESLQLHSVLVQMDSGLARVSVALDELEGDPVLAALPSVVLVQPAEDITEPPRSYETEMPDAWDTDKVTARIEDWAAAFVANDGEQMLDLTDQRLSTTVGPQGDSELARVVMIEPLAGEDVETARVRVVFVATSGAAYTFDVFVDRLSDAQPSIAGWGAPFAPLVEQ